MPGSKDNRAGNGRLRLRAFQVLLAVLLFVIWYVLTSPTLLPPIYFAEANQAAFFFGEPVKVFARLWQWFVYGEIYEHLWVTLVETLLAFLIGTVSGVVIGLWLALSPTASAVLDPYIKAVNDSASHRSEEHTSELQSPCNLVCRLLLEKKKTQNK